MTDFDSGPDRKNQKMGTTESVLAGANRELMNLDSQKAKTDILLVGNLAHYRPNGDPCFDSDDRRRTACVDNANDNS